jgi:glycosyltransferase involved in cell wall biosynthesis
MIIIIDPWKTNYLKGFINSLSKKCDNKVVLFTCHKNKSIVSIGSLKVYYLFFPVSDFMKDHFIRKFIRIIEYIIAYIFVYFFTFLNRKKIKLIHFQWLLLYKFDLLSLFLINKFFRIPIIYTAHDLFPHVNGSIHIKTLSKIYSYINTIILHGLNLKNLFHQTYPDNKSNIVVIPHGYENEYINIKIDPNIQVLLNSNKYKKVYLIFGFQFYNKGTDMIADIWINNKNFNTNNLLIIAGKINNYPELIKFSNYKHKNIMIINKFIQEEVLNYYLSISNVVLLPYRAASMTGQLSKVVNFKKAVLLTNVGSMKEYVKDNNVFLTNPNEKELLLKMLEINGSDIKTLDKMGSDLFEHFDTNFRWDVIVLTYLSLYKDA